MTSARKQQKLQKSPDTVAFFYDAAGLSLVSTLWILTILSVLAMQLLYSLGLENRAQRNFLDRTKYYYAAKSGFEWGLTRLRFDETNFDSLGEPWAEPIQEQIEDGVLEGRSLMCQVTLTDEASKINLNTAPVELIRNLLSALGVQASAEDAISVDLVDLATLIVEGRPYRTVRDVARVEGMTQEILYGIPQQTVAPATTGEAENAPPQTGVPQLSPTASTASGGLVNLTTVYSIDENNDTNGQQRVNINTAEAQQLTQIRGRNNQSVFSQGEADALIAKRDFDNLSGLLDVQAVSDDVFNNIIGQITVEGGSDQQNNNGDGDGGNGDGEGRRENGENNGFNLEFNLEFEDTRTNINTADAEALQELDGIDNGIAQRIVAHRQAEGDFENIDAIKDVKLLTVQEFAGIVDKITMKDGQTVEGLININTAPSEVLQLLPGMDGAKAQAIITRREEENPDAQNSEESLVKGNPFSELSQLLDLEEIDTQTFTEIVDWITYRSHGYYIESSGIDPNGKVIATCAGVVVRSGGQLVVQYWRQD